MKQRNHLRSRVNGLLIPVPGFAVGIMPRFGIEDNKLIFEQTSETTAAIDDTVGSVGDALPKGQLNTDEANELEELRAAAREKVAFEVPDADDQAEEPPKTEALTPAQKAAATRKAKAAAKAAAKAPVEESDLA